MELQESMDQLEDGDLRFVLFIMTSVINNIYGLKIIIVECLNVKFGIIVIIIIIIIIAFVYTR